MSICYGRFPPLGLAYMECCIALMEGTVEPCYFLLHAPTPHTDMGEKYSSFLREEKKNHKKDTECSLLAGLHSSEQLSFYSYE